MGRFLLGSIEFTAKEDSGLLLLLPTADAMRTYLGRSLVFGGAITGARIDWDTLDDDEHEKSDTCRGSS